MDDKNIAEILDIMRNHPVWKQDFDDLYDVFKKAIMNLEVIPEVHKSLMNVNLTAEFITQKLEASLKNYDLSIPQKNVLEALFYSNCELTQAQVSKFVFSSKSNISSLLERMEEKGLIKRIENKNNKREKLVTITDLGIEKLRFLFCSRANDCKLYENILTNDEAKELNRLLFKLKDGFENIEFK